MKPVKTNGKFHKAFSTIRVRILLITISLVVLISGIITMISYYLVTNNLRQNLLQTSEIRLSMICSSIDAGITDVTNYISSCQKSDEVQKFALESDTSDNHIKRKAHDFITNTYVSSSALHSYLVRFIIIGKNRDDIIQLVEAKYSSRNVSSQAVRELPYFELLHQNPGTTCTAIMSDPFYTARPIPMIPFLYCIQHPYNADEIGYIFAEVSTSILVHPIQNYLSETDDLFYFQIEDTLYKYADGALVPCCDTLVTKKNVPYKALHADTTLQCICNRDTGETSLIISQPLKIDDWTVMISVNEHELSRNILRSFSLILLIIVITASFIGILLFNFLSRTISMPVSQLQKRILRIEEGDFSKDSSTEWDHELGDIGKTINHLSENVLSLMNQRIEDEKQKKDYEYQMLQSQINPHFMHNTLNSIKWMATIQNATGIAEMTTALSRLLKNISNGTTGRIPIKDELALIQDYFTIQQYRYGGTITLSVQIDDDRLLQCQILRFTLQPLIENAIFHGIEPKGSAGNICIHIYRDDDGNIRLEVIDDGIGIEPDSIDGLLRQHTPVGTASFFKEIGLANVHKRLQYEFGDSYGLSIRSTPGQGTAVTILLPFTEEEENHV